MNYCSICNTGISQGMVDSSMKLYGKPVCTKPECEKQANDEAAKAAELFTLKMKPYTDCGFKIEENGLAVKVIGQAVNIKSGCRHD